MTQVTHTDTKHVLMYILAICVLYWSRSSCIDIGSQLLSCCCFVLSCLHNLVTTSTEDVQFFPPNFQFFALLMPRD